MTYRKLKYAKSHTCFILDLILIFLGDDRAQARCCGQLTASRNRQGSEAPQSVRGDFSAVIGTSSSYTTPAGPYFTRTSP